MVNIFRGYVNNNIIGTDGRMGSKGFATQKIFVHPHENPKKKSQNPKKSPKVPTKSQNPKKSPKIPKKSQNPKKKSRSLKIRYRKKPKNLKKIPKKSQSPKKSPKVPKINPKI